MYLPAKSALLWLVETCWSKVMTERQHFLEDAYKIEISANQTTAPARISDVSPLWKETANKAWQIYTGQNNNDINNGVQPRLLMDQI